MIEPPGHTDPSTRLGMTMLRFLRKHRTALIALAVYHFVFFFPTLFMQRIPSPNDVFFNYDPWAQVRHVDVQNSVMNDPPTSYFTLMSLLKHDWHAFHWNPYVASGIPGFGSSASAVLSPFVFIPTFTLPLGWVYAGLILLKLNVAFFFSYLWLREERLGRRGAAVGAIVIAASGAYAVRWWWQATNATALYPALLWIVRRRRVPVWAVTLIALSYALAGFPTAMLYGAYLTLAYALWRGAVLGRQGTARKIAGFVLGAAIAAPSLVPFAQFLRRSGYLVTRANSFVQSFPLRHLALFIHPDRLGNNAYHNWNGDPALGAANNYVGATIYLGLLPLLLVVVAAWNRRARARWFWFGTAAITLLCMFGVNPISTWVAHLPLLRYSPISQLLLLLPLPAGYLAAAASSAISRRHVAIAVVIAALCAADLALFAGRFYPFITPDIAVPPSTPIVRFLQQQKPPFRIAPFLNYLWPNTSELYRLEDVRSHFSSEAEYRRILQRIDPTSSSDQHTVITLNSLKFNFSDPFAAMLGIRYYLEHKDIDILRWTIFKESTEAVASNGIMTMQPGAVLRRHIAVDTQPFYALDIPVTVRGTFGRKPAMVVTLSRGANVLFERAFTPEDLAALNKLYVPVYEFLRPGDQALLTLRSDGMRVELVRSVAPPAGDDPLFYDRVKVPLIFDRELPDGRLFRNAGEVPRFHSVKRLSRMTHDAFLARTINTDFRDEAVLTGSASPMPTADAEVVLKSYREDEQRVEVRAPAGTFLASSEKLTPELRVTIDGRPAKPVEINLLFAGVQVPPGDHLVVFSRRIGRGWWPLSAAAALLAIALSITDAVRRR